MVLVGVTRRENNLGLASDISAWCRWIPSFGCLDIDFLAEELALSCLNWVRSPGGQIEWEGAAKAHSSERVE